jgi:hypothetical protein
LSEAEDRAALRLTQLEARELARARPQAVRLVSDREPFAWISAVLAEFSTAEFEDLLEQAWKLGAPDDLIAQYANASPG